MWHWSLLHNPIKVLVILLTRYIFIIIKSRMEVQISAVNMIQRISGMIASYFCWSKQFRKLINWQINIWWIRKKYQISSNDKKRPYLKSDSHLPKKIVLFVLMKFRCVLRVWSCRKKDLIRKVNFKIYDITVWLKNSYSTHIA